MDLKKRAVDEKKSLYATGGGPPIQQKLSENDDKRINLLHTKQIHGMESIYDSDFIDNKNTKPSTETTMDAHAIDDAVSTIAVENEEECVEFLEYEQFSLTEVDNEDINVCGETREPWNNYDPGKFKEPKNMKLNVKTRDHKGDPVKSSWSKLASVKAKWTEEKLKMEMNLLVEEHKVRMNLMEEKGKLETNLMEKKGKLEMNLMKERHCVEMQILQKKLQSNVIL